VRRKTCVGRPGRRRESLARVHFVPTNLALEQAKPLLGGAEDSIKTRNPL
jgi:hypothetical protein